VVVAALDPVIVDLVAVGTALDTVAAFLVVEVAVLHSKHRAGQASCHINGMLVEAVAAVGYLNVIERKGACVLVVAEQSCTGAVTDECITDEDVVCTVDDHILVPDGTRDFKSLKDIMVTFKDDSIVVVAGQDRALSVDSHPADRDPAISRAMGVEDHSVIVGCRPIRVDQHCIARAEHVGADQIGKTGVCPPRANLVALIRASGEAIPREQRHSHHNRCLPNQESATE